MLLLINVAVKAALVLALTATLSLALRKASASVRSLVWSVAILAVLAMPLVAGLTPTWEIPVLPAVAPPQAAPEKVTELPERPAALPTTKPPSLPGRGALAERAPVAERADLAKLPAWDPRPEWLAIAWATGTALLLAQLVAGLVRVAWIAHTARPLNDGPMQARLLRAAERIGVRRPVRLLASERIGIPVTWHYLRPCVLVPRGMESWSTDCQEAVLLHELEHVRRCDCWMQLLAQVTLALHWFNPLAWVATHRLGAEREQACDDAVLRTGFRASNYARHLLEIACSVRRPPRGTVTIALAHSTRLRGRVETILDPSIGRRSPNRRTTVSIASIALALVVPIAALQPVASTASVATIATPKPDAIGAPPTVVGTPTAAMTTLVAAPIAAPKPSPAATPQQPEPSIDQLVKMRIHGISPEFIDEMNDLFGPELDIDQLVKLRIHGVSGEFARNMRDSFGAMDMDDLVTARIHGVSPEWAAHMSRVLGESLTFDDLTKMRIHGVSDEFVDAMSGLFGHSDVDDLIRMRIHGVNEEYARAMRAAFGTEMDLDDLVNGRIHGISPEYARRMGELLEEELSFDMLRKMRIHGVSTEMIEELREAGYEGLTAEDLIDIKIHGMERILRKRRGASR